MADYQQINTSQRRAEIERDTSQLGFTENLKAGFSQTALFAGARKVGDEYQGVFDKRMSSGNSFTQTALDTLEITGDGSIKDRLNTALTFKAAEADMSLASLQALFGKTAEGVDPEYNKMDHIDALLADIPRKYHKDIMDHGSLEAAFRARARVEEDLEQQRIIAIQNSGGITRFAASLVDADLPLVFATGGAFGAAKISAGGIRAASFARMGARGQRITGATFSGASGGAQAGLVVGLANLQFREGSGMSDVAAFTVMGTLGGAVLMGAGRGAKETVNTGLKRLADDYADRLATNDPSLDADPFLNEATIPLEGMTGSQLFGEGSSVGARGVGDTGWRPPEINDPVGRVSDTSLEWIDRASRFNHDRDFRARRDEEADSAWQKMANSRWATVVGSGFQAKMYNSGSHVMNWMGQAIFESPNGYLRGKATAAALQEMYTRRIQTQLDVTRTAMYDWAKRTNNTFILGQGVSQRGKAAFFKEVMLERNARMHGRKYSSDPDVILAADGYDNAAREAFAIGKGREGQRAIDGFDEIKPSDHYTPYNWGPKIAAMIRNSPDPTAWREAMERGLAQGYRDAGMAVGKDADAVAHAVLRRAQLKDAEIDLSVISLLQADGREFLQDALEASGMGKQEIADLMNRLGVEQADRSKVGFAKHRNELDMETEFSLPDGSTMQLVDLLSKNLDTDWHRYSRRLSGSAALARHGITNRAQRKEIIEAIHVEQRSLGEDVTPRQELEAMFTNFDGGPIQGFSKFNSDEPSAQGAGVAIAKRAVNLAWLNKLGLTQLGETGADIAQHGIASWLGRGPMALIHNEIKAGNRRVLDDLSYLLGDIGNDHHHFAEHLNLDEVSKLDGVSLKQKLQSGLSSASYVQGFTSMFNTVRSIQQKTAALGAANSLFKAARESMESTGGISDDLAKRIWSDYGIDAEDLRRMEALIKDGTVQFETVNGYTFVNRLDMDKWDPDLAETFAASVTRSMNQIVQKSMAGEQDAWMHTSWGAVMTHLKTFPMQATQKQMVRHFRHHDAQAYGAVGITFATAGLVSLIRAGVDGKDMTLEEHGKRAFSYSNMTGFIPMAYDPLMTVIGMDDKRFNQFSPHTDITPPMLTFANDAMRLPGALAAAAAGTADGSDRAALRTTPYANTLLYGEMINGIASRNRE